MDFILKNKNFEMDYIMINEEKVIYIQHGIHYDIINYYTIGIENEDFEGSIDIYERDIDALCKKYNYIESFILEYFMNNIKIK